jgi:hypothetical protein
MGRQMFRTLNITSAIMRWVPNTCAFFAGLVSSGKVAWDVRIDVSRY